MSNKVTEHERRLIEELLRDGFTPRQAAFLVNRGERTGYYVQAEMKRRQAERYSPTKRWHQLTALLKGLFDEKELSTRQGRTKGRT